MQLFICIHTSSLCKNLKVWTFFILNQKPSFLASLCVKTWHSAINYRYPSLVNFQEFQSTWAQRSAHPGRRGSAWWHLLIHRGWWMAIWSTPLRLMRSSCGSVSHRHLTHSAVTVIKRWPCHFQAVSPWVIWELWSCLLNLWCPELMMTYITAVMCNHNMK